MKSNNTCVTHLYDIVIFIHDISFFFMSFRNFSYYVGRLAGYVEILAGRLGLKTPLLTLKQSSHWKTRWSKTSVSMIY